MSVDGKAHAAADSSEPLRALQTIRRSPLARLLRISPSTLDRMRSNGAFPLQPITSFGRPMWSRAAIARWLGGHVSMPEADYALLTLPEAARRMAVSRATAYRLRQSTDLASIGICVGGETRYPVCRLKQVLDSN